MSRRGEATVVPDADFASYYGRPILKEPTWEATDIAGYLFLGGLAGASAILAEGGAITGRPALRRASSLAAAGAATAGTVALVHDLGRPERFLNMLRVFKPTSPMSVGTYILAPFATCAGVSAASQLTGLLPGVGRLAGLGAAALGAPLATYTAALFADTAVPAWHEAYRELPFIFAGSGAQAAGGLAMAAVPLDQAGPARRLALAGAAVEIAGAQSLTRQRGLHAEPYEQGTPGRLMRFARNATAVASVANLLAGRRSRAVSALAGLTYVAASVTTRFAIFGAGQVSTRDPKYVVVPQRERAQRS